MIKKMQKFLKEIIKIIKKTEMQILPGQLSFFLLLSIIPLFAIIATIASELSLSVENFITVINQALPEEISAFIIQIISEKNIGSSLILFFVSGFILASNGPHSMIIGANLIYQVKNKDWLTRRIKALIMTIFLVILIFFILIVPVFGDKIIEIITSLIANKDIINIININYNILKYPSSILIIYFFIKLLYTMAPDIKIKSKTTTMGSIFTTVGWIIATEVYSFYVSYFSRYSLLYGSVANLLILFLWIYFLSYIFILGMALNASDMEEIEKRKDE